MGSRVAAVALLCFSLAAAGKSPAPQFDPAHPPRAGDEGVFYGPLVRVKDGDSLVAKVQGVEMEFRLSDIDAPELDQPYGREAKRELSALAAGKQLVLMPFDTDRYGRTVVHVWNGNTHINAELMKRGAAWFYAEFARNEALYDVEQEARNAKRGLWALPLKDRVEPWVWRERKRGKRN
ncbi:MAG TPA: thermonuclease family protein [Steroidobacteraceae bacterium]|jgi:Micrococcal nuclease (thermonuclease) homologs|nr:thermonuclease family protein [Steroidobacteraceae bacterium]